MCWLYHHVNGLLSFYSSKANTCTSQIHVQVFKKLCLMQKCHFFRYWVKAFTSLVVVMGIAWLFNILFFTEKLIFIAYVMTIFIASQGIIIFFLFVILSPQVWNCCYSVVVCNDECIFSFILFVFTAVKRSLFKTLE